MGEKKNPILEPRPGIKKGTFSNWENRVFAKNLKKLDRNEWIENFGKYISLAVINM